MTDVAQDGLGPLLRQALDGFLRERVATGHFFPNQQAHSIGPIEETRIFDLLVLAHAVESHGFDQLDIAAKGLIIRRGQTAIGPIPLIENEPKLIWLSIQNEAI